MYKDCESCAYYQTRRKALPLGMGSVKKKAGNRGEKPCRISKK